MSTEPDVCSSCGVPIERTAWSLGEEPTCMACGQGRDFRVEPSGSVRVLHLQGQGLVTEQTVMRGLERVRSLIAEGEDCRRVLIDFDGVNYLSSTILARLINLARLARESDVDLKLTRIRPDVQDIFRIARLEGFFERYPDLDTALRAFA